VARATRTDRAEARRRYRQTIADEAAGDELDASDVATPSAAIPTAARSQRPAKSAVPTPPAPRPGLTQAIRHAAQPADVRADLRALPTVVLRTKAFWIPAGLSALSGIGFLLFGEAGNVIAVLAFQAFVVPPPLAASFLGGLLAPRAAWAIGGLVGLTSSIVFLVVALLYPETASTGTGTVGSTIAQRQDAILFSLVISPLMGVAVGAFAGFYRRFLRTAGPGQPRSSRPKRAPSRR
jgi:hypothetical protein